MYDYRLDDADISHLHEDEEDANRREVRKLFIPTASGSTCSSYAGIAFSFCCPGEVVYVQLFT